MSHADIAGMKNAHKVLAQFTFDPKELSKGYADRWLRVELGSNEITVHPVTEQMKDLWTGGKGFDVWLMLQEVNRDTTWDSPENPICFSSGPLGGTTSFPGSGKTLVTSVSPTTGSVMDCNVGGYFGPYLKFAGFDAMMVIGKAEEEVIVYLDAINHRVTVETAPKESIDSHVLAEELTEMYAADELDRRNVAVVSAGRGAEHTRMGVLNFSFYDWRRRVARLKQAGRGGIGSVFRDKKVKALVLKNRGITPAWRIVESKASNEVTSQVCIECKGGNGDVSEIVAKWGADKAKVIHMLYDVQKAHGFVSSEALDTICVETGTPKGKLYHMATFYTGLSLSPDHPPAAASPVDEMAALVKMQLFQGPGDGIADPQHLTSFLAPGSVEAITRLVGKKGPDNVTPEDVDNALGASPLDVEFSGDAQGLISRAQWLAEGSCGTCTPCREGLHTLAGSLGRGDPDFARSVAHTVAQVSLCQYGKQAGAMLLEGITDCHAELAGKEVK
jgi:hypothetical protein